MQSTQNRQTQTPTALTGGRGCLLACGSDPSRPPGPAGTDMAAPPWPGGHPMLLESQEVSSRASPSTSYPVWEGGPVV